MQIPDERLRQVVGKLLSVAMKLGPVLQKIDFYSSQAAMTTIDGVEIRKEMIVTYKTPKSEGARTAVRTPSAP